MIFDTYKPDITVYNSDFIFESNTIHTELEIPTEMVILLMLSISPMLSNTSMLFTNNHVRKGGIFVLCEIKLWISVGIYAKFEKNEGSDGGAMAFYQQSSIWKTRSHDLIVVTLIFHQNLHTKEEELFLLKTGTTLRMVVTIGAMVTHFLVEWDIAILNFSTIQQRFLVMKCIEDGLIILLFGGMITSVALVIFRL